LHHSAGEYFAVLSLTYSLSFTNVSPKFGGASTYAGSIRTDIVQIIPLKIYGIPGIAAAPSVVQNFTDSARSSNVVRTPNSFYCSANSGISATARIPAKGATKWQTKLLAASADEALAH
jgi:hypothetical protein